MILFMSFFELSFFKRVQLFTCAFRHFKFKSCNMILWFAPTSSHQGVITNCNKIQFYFLQRKGHRDRFCHYPQNTLGRSSYSFYTSSQLLARKINVLKKKTRKKSMKQGKLKEQKLNIK